MTSRSSARSSRLPRLPRLLPASRQRSRPLCFRSGRASSGIPAPEKTSSAASACFTTARSHGHHNPRRRVIVLGQPAAGAPSRSETRSSSHRVSADATAARCREPKRAAANESHSTLAQAISRSLERSRATAWLCNWQTRDSLTSITAPISRRFIPRS